MELGQPEAVRPLDEHHRRVRDVDTDLDHRGRDEHVVAPVPEVGHDGVLVPRLHAAVQGGDAQLGKDLLAESLRLFHRRLGLDRVRGLDQRADDEDLMPFGHFFAHQGVGRLPLGADVAPGLDRDAPRRAMRQDRDVEIAVDHEVERARDRRGGHRQLVG